ncbi:hypothetical protein V6N11_051820 [Hibiscus sabdariffa]|uniref:Uncharacterized protein n=1 Tax=Hibiscus sabdariffa TaxID=183260 RepID=A0ABR2U8H7_9ROSI
MGGAPFEPSQAKWFFDFLNKSCMMELPIQGGTFTWSNQISDDDVIVEKLDRILSSLEWSEMFPRALGLLDVANGIGPCTNPFASPRHAKTVRANTICKLKDEQGNLMENDEDIAKHFQELVGITPNIISPPMNSMVSRDISEEEIREAVFSMAPLKAKTV